MKSPESMNVEEIRNELVEEFGYSLNAVADLRGKQRLAIELQKCRMRHVAEESPREFFQNMEVEEFSSDTTEYDDTDSEQELVRPLIGSPDWQSYVLAHLEENELVSSRGNVFPKTAGLRRVAQILLGEIVESGPISVDAPKRSDCADRATVLYEIKIAWKPQVLKYIDLSDVAPADRDVRTFREAADVWHGNTQDMYAIHPVATASTRAEGRALKKALQLNVLVAEEMDNDKEPSQFVLPPDKMKESDGKFDDNALIGGSQISMVKRLCKRLNISLDSLLTINYSGRSLDALTKLEAAVLLELLNRYQSKGKEHIDIPDNIKVSE